MTQINKNRIIYYITAFDEDVTPSCNLVSVVWPDGYKLHFLVDEGLAVGKTTDNFALHFRPKKIKLVLITHPHIDHIGLLPFIMNNGLDAPIYASEGTALLISNALSNSGKILLQGYKKANKKRQKGKRNTNKERRQNIKQPFYPDNIRSVVENVVRNQVQYDVEYEYSDRIKFTFIHNQHIFGAASIMVRLTDPSGLAEDVCLFFSGDYNNRNHFIPAFPLPEQIKPGKVGTMLIESTYGDKLSKDINYNFYDYLTMCIQKFRTIVFFTFSLGRTQDILLLLKKAQDNKIIPEDFEIYLDGALAISNSFIIHENPEKFFITEEAREFFPKDLKFMSKNNRQLRAFNDKRKIIITSSGNGSFGPARQYIQWFVERKDVAFIFGGFCTKDSLGYLLKNTPEGEIIEISGSVYSKEATTLFLEELSGHGKLDDLIAYIRQIMPYSVLINHGDKSVREAMRKAVEEQINPPGGVFVTSPCFTFKGSTFGVEGTIYSEPLRLE